MKTLSADLLASKVASQRKAKKITQQQLAEMIGVERSVLTRYETGNIEISMKNFVKICDALGLNYADVLSNIERM